MILFASSMTRARQHSFDQTYTVNFLGNVVGGEPVLYLNVPMNTLKHSAVEQIRDGSPVWFGNDVGKHLDRDLGLMDLELFDYDLVYGTKPTMNKGGAPAVWSFTNDPCHGVHGRRPGRRRHPA